MRLNPQIRLSKKADAVVGLDIEAGSIAANRRAGADVAVFPNDHIAGNGRKRMHKATFVDNGNVAFETVNHKFQM